MKIALCGSINFTEKFLEIKNELSKMGHHVFTPKSIEDLGLENDSDAVKLKSDRKKYLTEIKPFYTIEHFKLIENCDAILVVNIEKNGIKNYIGGATFSEIMVAFYLNKKIFFLNPIPQDEKLAFIHDELEAVNPTILNGNLKLI